MDANTNKKTLSVFLVALLVGSVVLVGVAGANHNGDLTRDPTASRPRAVVDKTLSTSITNATGTSTVNAVAEPSGGLIFNTTYDFTVTGLSGTQGSTFTLYKPTSFSGGAYTYTAVTGTAASAYADEQHIGKVNVTIFAQTFDTVGVWLLSNGAGETASFYVGPQSNLNVALSQASFPYTSAGQFVGITVTNLTAGGALAGDVPLSSPNGWPFPSNARTGTTGAQLGKLLYNTPLPGVGSYLIEAKIDTNGDGLPEYYGNTTATVTPVAAVITPVDRTVRSGFAENASFDVTYPNGTAVFRSHTATTLANTFQWLNLSVALPNGSVQFANYSSGTPGACQSNFARSALFSVNNISGGGLHCPAGDVGVWEFSSGGRFYYRPGAEWAAGTYTVNFQASVAGNDAAEYIAGAATVVTTAPAAVNLKVFNVTSGVRGDELREMRVQAATIGSSLGSYTIDLQIVGSASSELPLSSFFGASNVTITGDVLPVAASSVGTISGGFIRISNVVPTDVNGNVHVDVNWKGATTRVTIPITSGAQSTVDKNEIVVDLTSTLTVTVRDAFGNTVPTASVALLNLAGQNSFPGVAGQIINGTGAPGLGQNGQYTFNVRPTETGTLIVYSTIGAIVAGVNNQNFTYERVRVVPAHDLVVNLTTTSAMAGNTTHTFLNAITAEGHGVTTNGNYRSYFLNSTTLAELRLNGTSALAGITYPQVLGGVSQGSVVAGTEGASGTNLNVSLDPGTYYVYVCSNMTTSGGDCTTARHDNINNTPTFTVHPWRAVFSPERVASNPQLQSNTVVTVTVKDVNGAPAPSGSLLRIRSGQGAFQQGAGLGTLTVNATGQAQFTATGASIGDVVFELDVNGGLAHWTPLDTPFRVVGPNVKVTPDRIPLGRPASLVISVQSLNGTALTGLGVRVCGIPIGGNTTCTGEVFSDATGLATVGVNPTSTGTLNLQVSNVSANVNVTVFAGLDVTLSKPTPQANDTQEITVQVIGATGGEAGVLVNVTRDGVAVSGFPQTTGSSGRVVVPNLQVGNYTVTASKTGFDTATQTFTVSPAAAQAPTPTARFTLSNLRAPASSSVGQGITVTADVRNTGNADGTATVLLLVNGAMRDSQPVPVVAGGTETVAFDFTPNTAGNYNVTVKLATGQTLDAKSVTVTPPPSATPTPTQGGTPTPTQGGTPAPTQGGTLTPTQGGSPTPDPTPEPEVPGFEVVALVAALGVAMLVFRRRN